MNVDCLQLLCCLILHRMVDHWEDQKAASEPKSNSRSVIEGPSETILIWGNYLLLLEKCWSAFKSLSKWNVKNKLRCLFSKLETLPQDTNPLNDPVLPDASNDRCTCRVMSSHRHKSRKVTFLHHKMGLIKDNYKKNHQYLLRLWLYVLLKIKMFLGVQNTQWMWTFHWGEPQRVCLYWALAPGSWDRTTSAWSIHIGHDSLLRDSRQKFWASPLNSSTCQQPTSQLDFS